jgi:hypothetical protein
VKDNSELENILAVSSVVTLICGRHPKKAIEVDLIKSSQKQSEFVNDNKITRVTMYNDTYDIYM